MSARRTVALVAGLNLVAGAALGFAAARSVDRGPGGPGGGPGGKHTPGGLVAERLGLDPERAAKVDAILERHRPEFEAVRTESDAKLSAIRDRADEEMRAVLTPEQFEELLELRRSFERGERGGPR